MDDDISPDSALAILLPEGPLTLRLDLFSLFLTDVAPEDKTKYPETFELEGESVLLAGTIPPECSVGYGSRWVKALGRPLEIVAVGGEYGDTPSTLELPGRGPCPITGGDLTIESAGPMCEARAPLAGRCTLRIQAPEGEFTVEGRFHVPGATWG